MNKIFLLPAVFALLMRSASSRPQFGSSFPNAPTFNPALPAAPPNPFAGQTIFSGTSAGIGSGTFQNNQAIGTGTGIAHPEQGGFGTGIGLGASVSSPVGNIAVGTGQSISVGDLGLGSITGPTGPVVGTGTGIANPGQGGFSAAVGGGAAAASPVSNLALGQGQSISVGK